MVGADAKGGALGAGVGAPKDGGGGGGGGTVLRGGGKTVSFPGVANWAWTGRTAVANATASSAPRSRFAAVAVILSSPTTTQTLFPRPGKTHGITIVSRWVKSRFSRRNGNAATISDAR